ACEAVRWRSMRRAGFAPMRLRPPGRLRARAASPHGRACSRLASFGAVLHPLRGLAAVELAQLVLGTLAHAALRSGHSLAAAIDVEREHRHGRAERLALAPPAALGGSLQGSRDGAWILAGENPRLQVERVARAHHAGGPALSSLGCHGFGVRLLQPRWRIAGG